MSKKIEIISPIALDLGAKNTGAYFAHYKVGDSIDQVQKKGRVYKMEEKNYTFLMMKRTAARHQKRGYDRRQMAKRLFHLIWEKHFGLKWDSYIQQSISFLLNRRGFTFLTEEYDTDILKNFPQEAYNLLPEEFKKGVDKNDEGKYDFDHALQEWAQEEQSKMDQLVVLISAKTKLANLIACCKKTEINDRREFSNKVKTNFFSKFYKIDKKIFDLWLEWDIKGFEDIDNKTFTPQEGKTLPFIYQGKVNIKEWFESNSGLMEKFYKSATEKVKKLELDNWNFDLEKKFELEKALEKGDFLPEENDETSNKYIKTHLHHLFFAIFKIRKDLKSGARYRTKYFKEIQEILQSNKHTHNYLKIFCQNLRNKDFRFSKPNNGQSFSFKQFIQPDTVKAWEEEHRSLDFSTKDKKLSNHAGEKKISLSAFIESKALTWLICHISNLELKPLRKYFNDKRHSGIFKEQQPDFVKQTGVKSQFNNREFGQRDYWDEARMAEKFDNWILNEWRVDPEKDKAKAKDKEGDYRKLREKWQTAIFHSNSFIKKDRKKQWEELTNQWDKNHRGKLINFYMSTNPIYTIPPYQDNNNRRLPKCQSLLLNPECLNSYYPEWENWINILKNQLTSDYLNDYENQIKNLKSGKANPDGVDKKFSYFNVDPINKINKKNKSEYQQSFEYLKSRFLQFILDRSKKSDPLNLNSIYSYAKKIKQIKRSDKSRQDDEYKFWINKLNSTLSSSELPQELKSDPHFNSEEIFSQQSFLHFVCKYYKIRQKAKEGRLFIHPEYIFIPSFSKREDKNFFSNKIIQGIRKTTTSKGFYKNTGRFNEKNHLLTYCNKKPRQKCFQLVGDISQLLRISPQKLKSYIDTRFKNNKSANELNNNLNLQNQKDKLFYDTEIEKWLKGIPGLKTYCEKSAKEQKTRRGSLKLDIQNIYRLIQKVKNDKIQIQKILQNLKAVEKPFELYKLCEKSKDICLKLTADFYNENHKKEEQIRLERNPASAVYLLAQINNIVFKDRKGYASTCPICSMDNALRMEESENSSRASRLPAIPVRMIDGVVRRMARILGEAVAKDKWEDIELSLKEGRKVRIPIITESNQFEFEPSREELVKKQRTGNRKSEVLERGGEVKVFNKKLDRIKSVNTICPYNGSEIVSKEGEIDHIIPRSSKWGTLNDEANLIYTSQMGNQHKAEREFSLSDLNKEYKNTLFQSKIEGQITDEKIKNWIKETIEGRGNKSFKFGEYRTFINLKPDEQIAFQHALFLKDDPLREKVIQAIDNRNRAFVNGTQRYFAEVLANNTYKLYKKAKAEGKISNKKSLLEFDYFSVPASEIGSESIKFVRQRLEEAKDSSGKPLYPELQFHIKPQDKIQTSQSKNHDKGKNKNQKKVEPQTFYSHFIDAQIALIIALSKHQKKGSFKLDLNRLPLWPYSSSYVIDKASAKSIKNQQKSLFEAFHISENEVEEKELKRGSPEPKDSSFSHRPLFNSNAGAWKFLKLIEIRKGADQPLYLKGFLNLNALKECLKVKEKDWQEEIEKNYIHKNQNQNKNEVNNKNKDESKGKPDKQNNKPYAELLADQNIINLYSYGSGKYQFGFKSKNKDFKHIKIKDQNIKIIIHQIDKTKVAEFLLKYFHTKSDPSKWDKEDSKVLDILSKLWYHTSKKKIEKPQDIVKQDKDFVVNGLFNFPLFQSWESLKSKWEKKEKHEVKDKEFDNFIKNHFFYDKNQKRRGAQNNKNTHQKTRKDFSLPVISNQGWFLIKRKSWASQKNSRFIYQCLSESNDISKFLPTKSGKEVLALQYRQKSVFLFPNSNKGAEDIASKLNALDNVIPQDKWYKRPDLLKEETLKPYLNKVENQSGNDIRRTWFRLTFKEPPQFDSNFIKILSHFRLRHILKSFFDRYKDKDVKEEYKILENKLEKITADGTLSKKEREEKIKEINIDLKPLKKIKNLLNEVQENTLKIQGEKKFCSGLKFKKPY